MNNEKPYSDICNKLDIEEPEVHYEPLPDLDEKIEKKSVTNEQMDEDYKDVRKGILVDIEFTTEIISKLREEIMQPKKEDDGRYTARRAEIFAILVKTKSELRRELLSMYKTKKDMEPEVKEELEKNDDRLVTAADIKKLIKEQKKNNDKQEVEIF